jgi:hypothetical protein
MSSGYESSTTQKDPSGKFTFPLTVPEIKSPRLDEAPVYVTVFTISFL